MGDSSPLGVLRQHTPLVLALVVGATVATGLASIANPLEPLTRTLIAWDAALAVNLVAVAIQSRGFTPEGMAAHAEATDDGRYFVLFGSLLAVVASVAAIFLELQARLAPGLLKNMHVAFVFLTVTLSWIFVHTAFAKHYAHEYFGPAGEGDIRKGLLFPGAGDPAFGDFIHFAFVIGVANQTADIQIASKAIRRIVTLHGVVAFLFNTVILALTINLAAGLFQ